MPFMPRHLLSGVGWGKVFQHDNAPAHTARLTKNVLHTNDIYIMECPIMPAVMSPIEYF